jgi:hypothetical protein
LHRRCQQSSNSRGFFWGNSGRSGLPNGRASDTTDTTGSHAENAASHTSLNVFLDSVGAIDRKTSLEALKNLLANFVKAFGGTANSCTGTDTSEEGGPRTQEYTGTRKSIGHSGKAGLSNGSTECVGEIDSFFAASGDFFFLTLNVRAEQHGGFDQTGANTEACKSPAGTSSNTTCDGTSRTASKPSAKLRSLFTGDLAEIGECGAESGNIGSTSGGGLLQLKFKEPLCRSLFHTPAVFGDAGKPELLASSFDGRTEGGLQLRNTASDTATESRAVLRGGKRLPKFGFIALSKARFAFLNASYNARPFGFRRSVSGDIDGICAPAKPPRNLDFAHIAPLVCAEYTGSLPFRLETASLDGAE